MASAKGKVDKFVDKAYRCAFFESIHKLRQKEEYTDVTLQAGNAKMRCHRIVLAAASDYFKAMFGCGLTESTSDTVQMTMEPGTLTSIVDYMYTGETELTVENVESLVKACDSLQLDGLKAGCEEFMVAQVDPTNCVGFNRFAASYHLPTLQEKAKRLMLAEFKSVAFSDELKELSCGDLVDVIKDDDVRVDDEDIVFESVLDWIKHDLENRESSFETILEHVRLPYCTGQYLSHMKDTCDLLTPKCQEYLQEALSFQADIVHQHEVTSCRTLPRTNFRKRSCLMVMGGVTGSEGQDASIVVHNHFYNEDTNSWESLTELPQSVGFLYSVCFLGRSLLLTGGCKGAATDECWLYDLVTNKWEAMPPLITARFFHRSVSVGDCVYVVGGKGVGDEVLASCECLNLKRRLWTSIPDVPEAMCASMVVTYGNRIFVFGGADAQKPLHCSWAFDTMRGSWSSKSYMTEACGGGAAVTMNNAVYVVGSFNRTCLRYDFATDTWTQLSRPRKEHGNAPAVVWRGRILLAGGGGTDSQSSLIEQYDPLTDTWSDWKSELTEKLTGHGLFVVDLCHM